MRTTRTLAACVAAAALVLAGCSTEPATEGGGDSSGAARPTIEIWVPALMEDAAAEFPSTFPGADVNVVTIPNPFESTLLTKWAAGERPDVLYFHGIGNFLAQLNPEQNLVDLSDRPFVEQTRDGILDNSTEWNDKIYGAIVDYPGIDGFLFNKDTFDRLELTVPTNLAELLDVCAQIKQKDPDTIPIDMAGGDKWPTQILAFNLFNDGLKDNPGLIDDINSNQATFSDETFMRGYEGLKQVYDAGCFNDDIKTGTFENTQQRIVSGEAAMTAAISNFVQILIDAHGREAVDRLGFFPLSETTDVSSWQTTGQAIYVPKTGDEATEEAAVAYVDWITGEAYQDYVDATGQYPVIDGAEAPDDIPVPLQEANEAFETDTVAQYQQNLKATYGEFADYLTEMLFAGQTPAYVGERMQQEFVRNARAQKLPGF